MKVVKKNLAFTICPIFNQTGFSWRFLMKYSITPLFYTLNILCPFVTGGNGRHSRQFDHHAGRIGPNLTETKPLSTMISQDLVPLDMLECKSSRRLLEYKRSQFSIVLNELRELWSITSYHVTSCHELLLQKLEIKYFCDNPSQMYLFRRCCVFTFTPDYYDATLVLLPVWFYPRASFVTQFYLLSSILIDYLFQLTPSYKPVRGIKRRCFRLNSDVRTGLVARGARELRHGTRRWPISRCRHALARALHVSTSRFGQTLRSPGHGGEPRRYSLRIHRGESPANWSHQV